MKVKVTIQIEEIEKTSYGQNIRSIGSYEREFNQEIPTQEVQQKLNHILSEARLEVSEIFNRKIEAEGLAAAKAKADAKAEF